MNESEMEKQRTNVDNFTEGLLQNIKRKLDGQAVDHEQVARSIRAIGEAVKTTLGEVTPVYMAAGLLAYGEALDYTFKANLQQPTEDGGRVIDEDVVDGIKIVTH
jgi:hypothetical protein